MPSIQDAIANQRSRLFPKRLDAFAKLRGSAAAEARYKRFLSNALPGQQGGIQQNPLTPGDRPVSTGRPNGGVVSPPMYRPPMDTSPPQIGGTPPMHSKPDPRFGGQPLPMPPQGLYGPNMTAGESPFGMGSSVGEVREVGGAGGGMSQDGGGMGPMGEIPPSLQMQAPPPSGPIFAGGGGYMGGPRGRIMRRRNQIAGLNSGIQSGPYSGG